MTPPQKAPSFIHIIIQQSVLSTCYAPGTRRCNTLRATRALHLGIPGGQQRQGQMPERKGQGQLSSGRRGGHRLRALDKGGTVTGEEEAERLLELRKGQALSEGIGLLNGQRQGEVTGSGGIPGGAHPGAAISGAL